MDKDLVIEIIRIVISGLIILGGSIGLIIVSSAKYKKSRPTKNDKQWQTQISVLATICVIGLALFNNYSTTYIVSIFIVATLITALEFLERLAAIIMNRKFVFDYYTEISKADPKDLIDKREEEVKEEKDIDHKENLEQSVVPLDLESALEKHKNFEIDALEILHRYANNLGIQRIDKGQAIQYKDNKLIIDAIATTAFGKVIIEVKASKSLRILQNGAEQLRRMSKYYELWFLERDLEPPAIKSLLIAPYYPGMRNSIRHTPIMIIDVQNKTIKNIEKITQFLNDNKDAVLEDEEVD